MSTIGYTLDSIRRWLHTWGVTSGHEAIVGELAIESANEALDRGDLSKALFELEAVPPQTRRFLGVWASQAKLRLSLDRSIAVLVDYLATKSEKISN
jgi:hypothetical protein